jgi:hypothetical protein
MNLKLPKIPKVNMNDKIIVWGSIIALVSVATLIIVNRVRKSTIREQILGDIENGVNEEGTATYTEIKYTDAFEKDFYKNAPSTAVLITAAQATDKAKRLYGYFDKAGSDDEAIVEVIKELKTKAQISQVALAYYNIYKSELGADIQFYVDKTIFGVHSGSEHRQIITDYVNALPNY